MRQPRRAVTNTTNANTPRRVPQMTAPVSVEDVASKGLIPEAGGAPVMIRIPITLMITIVLKTYSAPQ